MVAILEAIHARKVFGGGLPGHRANTAVEDFSLVFDDEKPSITAVVGESGSGKTMIARLLRGFETPTAGEIQYRGKQLNSLDGRGHSFRGDVQVYNPFYRIDHVLKVPIQQFGLARSNQERTGIIDRVLTIVGLQPAEVLGRHPQQFSSGQ